MQLSEMKTIYMQYNKDKHHRRSIRLKENDYSQAGAYFVTICAWNKEYLFGNIVEGAMQINESGLTVQDEWIKTADIRKNVELDEFIVMPNHIHGIIVLSNNVGARRCLALPDRGNTNTNNTVDQDRAAEPANEDRATHRVAPTVTSGSIGAIIGQFKSIVTKRINQIRNTPGHPVWQRNYYEHVIRDDNDLNRIREYIINNPAQWAEDEENPVNMKPVS
jgi:putative transposase